MVLARLPLLPADVPENHGAVPGYIYATDADGVYVNLFVSSRQIGLEGQDGQRPSRSRDDALSVGRRRSKGHRSRTQRSSTSSFAPRAGARRLMDGGLYSVAAPRSERVQRFDRWAARHSLTIINGTRCSTPVARGGHVRIHMAMPAQRVRADDHVEGDRGRAD